MDSISYIPYSAQKSHFCLYVSIDIVIFSIIPVVIKMLTIVFIDFMFLLLLLWTTLCVHIYIAVITNFQWRIIRTASQLHGVWWQSAVQVSACLKRRWELIICSASLCYHRSLSSPAPRSGSRTWPRSRSQAPSNYGFCEIRPEKLIIRHHSLRPVITKSLFGKTKEFLLSDERESIRISTKT